MLNVTEGGLPSSRATNDAEIEEERRLLYVAMTRAKQELTLMVPMHKSGPGSYQAHQNGGDTTIGLSRFIPDSLLAVFEPITWRSNGGEGDDAVASDAIGAGELAVRVRDRWCDA